MKKKAILVLPALLVALAGIVMTGCPTDPEPEPERANWTYTSPSMEITIPEGENAEVNIFPDEESSATRYRILKDAQYEITFTGTTDVEVPRLTAGFADWDNSSYWIAVDWENKQAIQTGSTQTVTWQVTATAFSVGAYATKHHNSLVLRAEYVAGPNDDQPLTQDVKLNGTWTIKQLTAGSTPEPEPDGEGIITAYGLTIKSTHATITPTLVSAYLQDTTDYSGSCSHKFDKNTDITANTAIPISFTDLGSEAKAWNNFRLDFEFATSAIGQKAKLEISGFSITRDGANMITGVPAFAREGTETNSWTKETDITTQLSAGVYQIEVTVIGDTETDPTKGIAFLALPL